MTTATPPVTRSTNALIGALSLAGFGSLGLLAAHLGPGAAALQLAALLGSTAGLLCFCEEMGAGRPLNRAAITIFAGAFVAKMTMTLAGDGGTAARAGLAYVVLMPLALFFWSVALMHRSGAPKTIGAIGTATNATALGALLAGHLLLGLGSLAGFAGLVTAAHGASGGPSHALTLVDALFWLWSLAIAALLWRCRITR